MKINFWGLCMKAVIKKVKKDLIIFETEDFDCAWGELYVETGTSKDFLDEDDEIIGVFDNFGITEITIEKSGIKLDIWIEDFGLSYKQAFEAITKKE
jgi:hypothetical protein